ncbi:hypothetical protein TNCT_340781 [Trichonephila clavata]|uniref:Uncharacterized protein n=1 Tax=Trichonephila clavata TaxID=2740835 RepID=A0A8X6IED8_TRICU|nr:hypothetical protein TNCT_340781 [Trichonephila clavata]
METLNSGTGFVQKDSYLLKDNLGVGEKGILQERAVGPETQRGGNRILQKEPWDGDSQWGFYKKRAVGS